MSTRYWLMKTEPNVYSIDDLAKEKECLWDGIRNYQARNFMMNDMKPGDHVLIYHSRVEPMAVVGLAEVSEEAQVDPSQFKKNNKYFDPKSTKEKPRWHCVKVRFKNKFPTPVTLQEIKSDSQLKEMMLIRRGMRLSIQPVSAKEFNHIVKKAKN